MMIVKLRLRVNNNVKLLIVRVYSSTTSKSNSNETKTVEESSSSSSSSSSTSSSASQVNGDFIKTNLNKAVYFTSTTLNRLYLRENFVEKLNNSINASRNYINETLTNVVQSTNDIRKSMKKLEANKKEVLGDVNSANASKNTLRPVVRVVEIKKNETKRVEYRMVEDQTKFLCSSIRKSSSVLIKTLYIEALNKHLYENIETRNIVFDEKIDKHLLDLIKHVDDKRLAGNINECLALLGVINMARNRGINCLSLDGGGAKGFVTIEVLKNIEETTGKRIHELFDYICGTSTGAVLACLVGVYKLTLNECESYYKKFVEKIFERNTAASLSNLLMTQSWYDAKLFENMLKEAMGETLLINSSRDSSNPKISVVSSLTTPNHMKVFLFRNYNLPINQQSHYDGTHKYSVWQAVRASSAAPGYYQDFKIEGQLFHDGGVLCNNPTAICIHEAKQLWPDEELQCVISVGNGRYSPVEYMNKCESLSIKQKVNRIVGGATSTENVHTVLHDLLPPKAYFRFNPYMSEEFHLDENRPDKWEVMQHDAQMYMRRNDKKFQIASQQLLKTKTPLQKLNGFLKQKINSLSN